VTFLRLVGTLRASLPSVVPLMRDHRVPAWLKVGVAAGALVLISPLDPFADVPVLGALDDAVMLALLAHAFVVIATRLCLREARFVRAVAPPEGPVTMSQGGALPRHARLTLRLGPHR